VIGRAEQDNLHDAHSAFGTAAIRAESALGAPDHRAAGYAPGIRARRAVRGVNRALLAISGTPLPRRRSRVFAPLHTLPPGAVFTCPCTARPAEERAIRWVRRRSEALRRVPYPPNLRACLQSAGRHWLHAGRVDLWAMGWAVTQLTACFYRAPTVSP